MSTMVLLLLSSLQLPSGRLLQTLVLQLLLLFLICLLPISSPPFANLQGLLPFSSLPAVIDAHVTATQLYPAFSHLQANPAHVSHTSLFKYPGMLLALKLPELALNRDSSSSSFPFPSCCFVFVFMVH